MVSRTTVAERKRRISFRKSARVPGLPRSRREPSIQSCDESRVLLLVITDLRRDDLERKLDALLREPGHIPKVAVLDPVFSQGKCDNLVGQDFLAAFRLKNKPRGAEVDAVDIPQHHGTRVVAGNGGDVRLIRWAGRCFRPGRVSITSFQVETLPPIFTGSLTLTGSP